MGIFGGNSDAVCLGVGSIATQTILLRFILASPGGGEFYAALALGGWIAWVGLGALWGGSLSKDKKSLIWTALGIAKLPLALLIFVYPSFFTTILDPVRFLPLAFLGMAIPGMLYGLLFAMLITTEAKANIIYANEAAGSVIGGLLTALWVLAEGADFGLLALISALEISRAFRAPGTTAVLAAGIIAAVPFGSHLDMLASRLRWRDFKVERIRVGSTGRWCLLSRNEQTTIAHNGSQVATIPDRPSAEESLLWPLLYHSNPRNALLIGYEGVPTDRYLPAGIYNLTLIEDRAFIGLGALSPTHYTIADPLEYRSNREFDLVYLNLKGCSSMADYRKETVDFIARLKRFLSDNGLLYVSAPSDENYLSSYLADYLSALYGSLKANFDTVAVIPGPKMGFLCRLSSAESGGVDPMAAVESLNIDSPYFNAPLVFNRLMPYRISNALESLDSQGEANKIGKPASALSYLRWQNSIFGRSGIFFKLYEFPYLLLLALPVIPFLIFILRKTSFSALLGVTLFGFAGMAFEITLIYLFSAMFGTLYLHIGLMVAVFMAGLALGSGVAGRLKSLSLPAILVICALTEVILVLSRSPFGTNSAIAILYLLSASAGFATGGGYGQFSRRLEHDARAGATLYGADLYGAFIAAVAMPGLLMVWGLAPVAIILCSIGLVIAATLSVP